MTGKFKCLKCNEIFSCHLRSSSNLKKHYEKKHSEKAKELSDLFINQSKRGRATMAQPSIKSAFQNSANVPQNVVNMAIIQYIASAGQPFSLVRNPSFVSLIKTLAPNKTIPAYPTVIKELSSMFQEMKSEIEPVSLLTARQQ